MGSYLGGVYFGEYASEGTLPVNPWIPACGEASGDCLPASVLGGVWPECGDCLLPSVLPTPEPEMVGHARAPAASAFGAL